MPSLSKLCTHLVNVKIVKLRPLKSYISYRNQNKKKYSIVKRNTIMLLHTFLLGIFPSLLWNTFLSSTLYLSIRGCTPARWLLGTFERDKTPLASLTTGGDLRKHSHSYFSIGNEANLALIAIARITVFHVVRKLIYLLFLFFCFFLVHLKSVISRTR